MGKHFSARHVFQDHVQIGIVLKIKSAPKTMNNKIWVMAKVQQKKTNMTTNPRIPARRETKWTKINFFTKKCAESSLNVRVKVWFMAKFCFVLRAATDDTRDS